MAIARVQFKYGAIASVGTTVATGNFASGVTAGNLMIVIVRDNNSGAFSGIADTLGTSYGTVIVEDTTQNPRMRIFAAILASSGTNSITGTWGANTNHSWVFGIEVSGIASSSFTDAFDNQTGAAVTDLVSSSFTTAQADEYVVCAAAQPAFNTYTAGTDFTLLAGDIGTGGGTNFGGVEEYITSATLTNYVAHMTASASHAYTMVVATFKGAAVGGGGLVGPLIGGHLTRSRLTGGRLVA